MTIKTMDKLFEHELKDIFYAEAHLLDALTKMEKETKHKVLKAAFASHKKETKGHVQRLKKAFSLLGLPARPVKCDGIEGLLKEKQSMAKEKLPQALVDFTNLGAGIKAERYEISAYEQLIHMARTHLDIPEVAELLEANLEEERAALDKLSQILEAHSEADMEAVS